MEKGKKEAILTQEELVKQVKELEVEDAKRIKEEGLTEVTNLATEIKKSGIEGPTKAQILDQAKQDYAIGSWTLSNDVPKLSKRGVLRVMTAASKLPEAGQKVDLQKDELRIFGILQRFFNARFTLTLHMVEYEMNQMREQQQKEEKENVQEKTSG